MSTDIELAPVDYTEANMKTLKDAAHIRQNPGMYVGNTDTEGLHHLLYEVVYNSVDEALAGFCTRITVTVHDDESASVTDDGRGIPVGVKADTGKSTLETALTVAGTSGKFDNAAYRVSAGLHGMGAKAMNALSEWCEAEVRRDGRVHKMEFERGYAAGPLHDLGPAPKGQTGTSIRFKPDPEMFGELKFAYEKIANRVQQIAFLNKGLTLAVKDERDGRAETFKSDTGIPDYVLFLNTGETVGHAPIYICKEIDGVTVEVCLQYNTGENKLEMCFTNNAYNKDGGTHLSGFRAGLTRSVAAYGKKAGHFKEGMELKGDDFREGLTAVVSVSHPDPSFESQTKVKLTSAEVEGQVSSVVYEGLSEFLEKNPKEGTWICKKVALSAEARLAAKKAREAIKDRKSILGGGGLPGKLMDCTTRDRELSELFLVEGDSAGGSAESGRDRMYQAVLPLRGKVLNVEKARLEKLLKNNEISALISAIGVDILNVEDVSKVRYGKIIILTDADVDGQHIRTLLLTFFFRQMRKLIEDGRIFVSRPPLFKVVQKKETRFVQTREEMARELNVRGLKDTTLALLTGPKGEPLEVPRVPIAADALGRLLPLLADIDAQVVGLIRRGLTLDQLLRKAAGGPLPPHHMRFPDGRRDDWYTEDGRKAELERLAKELGREPVRDQDYHDDLGHEVVALGRLLPRLEADFKLPRDYLVPLERVAGREPPLRLVLEHGDHRKELTHLREVVSEVRRMGEKGMAVTRFKGLGEMDPEELWATTLDPTKRILLKVTLADAFRAEKLFRTLMGEEVEGRRNFIFQHKIDNPEDIDYGA